MSLMKLRRNKILTAFVLILFIVAGLFMVLSNQTLVVAETDQGEHSLLNPPTYSHAYANLQAAEFIENVGQFDARARFQINVSGTNVWLAEDGIWITYSPDFFATEETSLGELSGFKPQVLDALDESSEQHAVAVKLSFVGANPHPIIEPFGQTQTKLNYFKGNISSQHYSDVPVWTGVVYRDLYPNVDLELISENGMLRPKVLCRENCGSAIEGLQLHIEGADSVSLSSSKIQVVSNSARYLIPLLSLHKAEWITIGPYLKEVALINPFNALNLNRISNDSIADNTLVFSTYLGSIGAQDGVLDIAIDRQGFIYVVGQTGGFDFPATPGAYQTNSAGPTDIFITKLDHGGTSLIYSTYLGGNTSDNGASIAVDSTGSIYVSGSTLSWDFPVTPNAYQTDHGEGDDIFVTKFDTNGLLKYSTLIGGSRYESVGSIAVDSGNNVYVTGRTNSLNFPVTPGAYETVARECDASSCDGFITKLNADGSNLVYSTYLGGTTDDWMNGIAVNEAGDVFVTGTTYSHDFPVTPGAAQSSFGIGFVTKLNASGNQLIYSTYLQGYGQDIAIDEIGAAYIVGGTSSGDVNIYLTKLNNTGSGIVYSNHIGGSGDEAGRRIGYADPYSLYITGGTTSSDFPVTSDALQPDFGGGSSDALVMKLNPVNGEVLYSSYLGGSGYDDGYSTVSNLGYVYVVGETSSSNFPVTSGAFQATFQGVYDGFITKLELVGTPIPTPTPSANTTDLIVESIDLIQVIEGQDLVQNKATAVKVVIRKIGGMVVNNVSVQLSSNSRDYHEFFVAEPSNMNQYKLVSNNLSHPLVFTTSELTKTIYFFSEDFAPDASLYQVSATVDYLGTITESNENNNSTLSVAKEVVDTRWGLVFPDLHIRYHYADWDGNRVPFETYVNSTDHLIEGLFPVSEEHYTSSVAEWRSLSTNLWRGPDGRFGKGELRNWIFLTVTSLQLAQPSADRHIAVVPPGWFAEKTVFTDALGIADRNIPELVIAEARTVLTPNNPITAIHELGHSYGLHRGCEEYYFQDESCVKDTADNAPPERIGDYAAPGLWVSEGIPIQVTEEHDIYNFMGAYSDTLEYWVANDEYSSLLTTHAASSLLQAQDVILDQQAIVATGLFENEQVVNLSNWYVLPQADISYIEPGPYLFAYLDAQGNILTQKNFDIFFEYDENGEISPSPFVFTIPYVTNTAKIIIKLDDSVLVEKQVSPHPPAVTLSSPNGGEEFSNQINIQWSSSDEDEDALSHAVLISADNGDNWEPVAIDIADVYYNLDISDLPSGSQYLVKVISTDGFNTSQDISNASFAISGTTRKLFLPVSIAR